MQIRKMMAPSAQKGGRWRLAGLNHRPTVPFARKVWKTTSFMNRNHAHL